jgi:hypothetical protein
MCAVAAKVVKFASVVVLDIQSVPVLETALHIADLFALAAQVANPSRLALPSRVRHHTCYSWQLPLSQ